nr:hypothetical protein [Tanacetum cinerariifolium]
WLHSGRWHHLFERPEHDERHAAGVVLLPPGSRDRAESQPVPDVYHSYFAGGPSPRWYEAGAARRATGAAGQRHCQPPRQHR